MAETEAIRMLFAGQLEPEAESAFAMGGRIAITRVRDGAAAAEALTAVPARHFALVATKFSGGWKPLLEHVRRVSPGSFVLVWSVTATTNAASRLAAFDAGAHMVSCYTAHVVAVLATHLRIAGPEGRGELACPTCPVRGLSSVGIWLHYHMAHVNEPPQPLVCPVCVTTVSPLGPHLFALHAPSGVDTSHELARAPKLYAFALVVCIHPRTGRMLLVHEFANLGLWLPGGRVDAGEQLTDAAVRETFEEAGVRVVLTGLLAIETSPAETSFRLRAVFLAEPVDEHAPVKTVPDFESCGAVWADPNEILAGKLALRGREPVQWARYLAQGRKAHSLDVLASER